MITNHSPTHIGNHNVSLLSTFPAATYETETGKVVEIDTVVISIDKGLNKTYVYMDSYTTDYVNAIEKEFGNVYVTDSKEDIYEKANAMLDGVEYDSNVIMTLDLDKETLAWLEEKAKNENRTVDSIVEEALFEKLKEIENTEKTSTE